MQDALCTVSVLLLFYILLIWGVVRTQRVWIDAPLSQISGYAIGRNSHIISLSFLFLAALVLVGLDSSSKGV